MKINKTTEGYEIVPLTSDSEQHIEWFMRTLTSCCEATQSHPCLPDQHMDLSESSQESHRSDPVTA